MEHVPNGSDTTASGFEHTAVFYADRASVVDELAPTIAAALAADEPVVVSGDADLRDGLEGALGGAAEGVEFLGSDARYGRPVDAMASLWAFTEAGFQRGGRRVHSIGEIPMHGTPSDESWLWYEAAVNDVFAHVPVVATCLYDRTRLTDVAAIDVERTHPSLVRSGNLERSPAYRPGPHAMPFLVHVPDRPPAVSMREVRVPADARASVTDLRLDTGTDERVRLVISELVTNAIRHGAGAADVDVWIDRSGVVLRVRDDGRGFDDPFATLRPPRRSPTGGQGLWIANVESDELAIRSNAGGTEVVARVRTA